MAKVSEDQLMLIDTDHPAAKKLKKAIAFYEGKVNARKDAKTEENDAREALVEMVREIGTPDANTGAIHVSINGVSISIEPEDRVKIKHKGEDDIEEGEAEEETEGNEPAASRRGR